MSEPTTANELREWATGADETMAPSLLALADHAEKEISAAKIAAEASVLAVAAEALDCEPEAFAVAAAAKALSASLATVAAALGSAVEPTAEAIADSIRVTLAGLRDSIESNKTLMRERDEAKASDATLWRVAREFGLAPEDHGALNHDAVVARARVLATLADAVRKLRCP